MLFLTPIKRLDNTGGETVTIGQSVVEMRLLQLRLMVEMELLLRRYNFIQ